MRIKRMILRIMVAAVLLLLIALQGVLAERDSFADTQIVESFFETDVKPIRFSDSKKYNRERQLVRKITGMAKSERNSEGSMKKTAIRIALEDINDDGIKEILSYIVQSEWRHSGHIPYFICSPLRV